MMDKTDPGAFNLPIYKMFADPFNTIGLVMILTLWQDLDLKYGTYSIVKSVYGLP